MVAWYYLVFTFFGGFALADWSHSRQTKAYRDLVKSFLSTWEQFHNRLTKLEETAKGKL